MIAVVSGGSSVSQHFDSVKYIMAGLDCGLFNSRIVFVSSTQLWSLIDCMHCVFLFEEPWQSAMTRRLRGFVYVLCI